MLNCSIATRNQKRREYTDRTGRVVEVWKIFQQARSRDLRETTWSVGRFRAVGRTRRDRAKLYGKMPGPRVSRARAGFLPISKIFLALNDVNNTIEKKQQTPRKLSAGADNTRACVY